MKKLALLAMLVSSSAMAETPITINFAAEIGGKPFTCGQTYSEIGASKAKIKVNDYRMFVSNAAMLSKDGSTTPISLDQDIWQKDSLALIDFEDASAGCTNGTEQINTSLRGTVPDGDYNGLTFTIGVPFEKNHLDPTVAPSPLSTTSMFWNWRAGYKFLRIDMVPTKSETTNSKGWFMHLGSTMCKASSKTEAPETECKNPNHMQIKLDKFDASNNTVIIDPAKVIAESNLEVNTPNTSPGCMSFPNDPDCDTVMTKLGLSFKDIAAGEQQLVSVR